MKLESRLFDMKAQEKTFTAMLIDSAIIGGLVFLSTLGNTFPSQLELFIAIKASLLAFLTQLAFEKGIKKYKK